MIFDGEGRKRGGGVGGEGDSCENTKAAIMGNAGKNGTSKGLVSRELFGEKL